jgi:hypothetical protein
VVWYLSGPGAPAISVALALAIATLLVTVLVLRGIELERAALVRRFRPAPGAVLATLQALLAVSVALCIPAAVAWVTRPLRSGPVPWLLVAVGLAAVAVLLSSAQAVPLAWDAPPEPRLAAAAGVLVSGAVLGLVGWQAMPFAIVAALGLAALIGQRLGRLVKVEQPTVALGAIALVALVCVARSDLAKYWAEAVVRLGLGAFGGCLLAAVAIGAVAHRERSRGSEQLDKRWSAAVLAGLALGALSASWGTGPVVTVVSASLIALAGVLSWLAISGLPVD